MEPWMVHTALGVLALWSLVLTLCCVALCVEVKRLTEHSRLQDELRIEAARILKGLGDSISEAWKWIAEFEKKEGKS